jgi:ABC-type sugar transport system ATPase subunit
MASVSFERVEKAYGTTKVIHGVGFDIHDGEFTSVDTQNRPVVDT